MLTRLKATFRYFNSVVPFRLGPALITTAVLVTLLLLPVPEGLKPKAWGLVAIFLTTIVAIILKVMPIGVMAVMAIVVLSLSQVTSTSSKGAIADALTAFDSPLIWLIVVAILISRGLKKTGLGSRIGLMFISLLGKRTIGIGYGLAVCELVLAPFTPSNTARGGGIVHPIMKSIANAFDSDPAKGTEGKVGTYLALVNYHANPITSAMFLTATAPNPLVVDYIAKATNQSLHLTWTSWALCMLLPGLLCLLVMPLVIYAAGAAAAEGHAERGAVCARRTGEDGPRVAEGKGHAGDLRAAAAAVGRRAGDGVRSGVHAGSDRGRLRRPVRADHHRHHRLGRRAVGEERLGHAGLVRCADHAGRATEQARRDHLVLGGHEGARSLPAASAGAPPPRSWCWPSSFRTTCSPARRRTSAR